ncbi:hypothetical protein GOP47_0020520 [Adiantum capillus-veneris]|uniref:Uncharacterized protein n=1 Tax=Adiantum capillus-veneris TaxID=13818 RepID=A0A9D4Z7I6_ADICA|nr:hypothetical protein GOP47_0020520 [Adiantum capillus-veneris]
MEEQSEEYGIIDVPGFHTEDSLMIEVTLDTYMVNIDDLSTKSYETVIVPCCGTQSVAGVGDT